MFLFVGKHQCFKTDAGCYRLPVEATQQCGDVEENLARSKTQYFGLLTKGARWNRFSSNKCIVIFFFTSVRLLILLQFIWCSVCYEALNDRWPCLAWSWLSAVRVMCEVRKDLSCIHPPTCSYQSPYIISKPVSCCYEGLTDRCRDFGAVVFDIKWMWAWIRLTAWNVLMCIIKHIYWR